MKQPSMDFDSLDTKPILVTTSWDDGDRSDLRLAELLLSRGIGGTFYVPITPYSRRDSLAPADLRALVSEGFEIGAHGVSHKLLSGLSATELSSEVAPCKPRLEDMLGSEVRMFCYPRGRYDANVVRALNKAGYRGARTVRMLSTELNFDPFEMPTTLQVFPHRISSYVKNLIRSRMKGLEVFLAHRTELGDWLDLGKAIFDTVCERGGIWHLYGHSWEIDEFDLWNPLSELLDYVCGQQYVTYLSNGELLQLLFPGCVAGSTQPSCGHEPRIQSSSKLT